MHYTLSDYITDLIQNSLEAKSSMIVLELIEKGSIIKVYVADNGSGMTSEELARVRDPFFTDGLKHESRKVGLGVSFLAQMAEQCQGTWDIQSEKEVGTSLFFTLDRTNVDVPPLGDLVSAVVCFMNMGDGCEIRFHRERDNKGYTIVRSELEEAVGDFSDAQSLIAVRKYVRSLEDDMLFDC